MNQDYLKMIPSCFGDVDTKFAVHNTEVDHAIALLKECTENDVPLNDLITNVEIFLRKKTDNQQHIDDQLDRVKKLFDGWLYSD